MKRFLVPMLLAVLASATASLMLVRSLGACECVGHETLLLRIDSVRVEGLRQEEVSLYDDFSVRVRPGGVQLVALDAQGPMSGSSYLAIYEKQ